MSILKRTKANMHSQLFDSMRFCYMNKTKFEKSPGPRMNMMKFKSKG